MLKKFVIKNLFNRTDVEVSLKRGVNIFIGENGIGKTTILSLLNAFLTYDVKAITKTMFDSVTFFFEKHQISFSFENIKRLYLNSFQRRHYYESERYYDKRREYSSSVYFERLARLVKIIGKDTVNIIKNGSARSIRNILQQAKLEAGEEIDFFDVEFLVDLNSESISVLEKLNDLQFFLNCEVLYFPTFRRIETDLSHFNLPEEAVKEITRSKTMNFGMGDVENTLNSKLNIIDNEIRQGFNKMTTTLLGQYVNHTPLYASNIDIDELTTILSILSDSLPESLINNIEEMMKTGEIYRAENQQLLNLLNCLMRIYEDQKANLNSIEKFVAVCNSYFYNKNILFDRNKLKVEIRDEYSSIIKFAELSSGEKQMVSIFSKLYLDNDKKYFVLFDEPELSLSIEWQQKLIPDIVSSGNCRQLFAVTHSPFIFQNEYDETARSLQACMRGKYAND